VNRFRRTAFVAAVAGVSSVGLAGCGGGSTQPKADEVRSYVTAVEKVRLPVNDLLEGADPIFDDLHDKKITPQQASDRFDALERRFAGYLVMVQKIAPSNPVLAAINRPYANTYFFEDNYLATMASDLAEGDFDNLPNTQDQQRLAIIIWRTKLQVIADKAGVTLPADIQQAGRGEIAPAPEEDDAGS
jgi:hypothetical protein